ncbi:MAG: hypothetical protein MZW92_53945 [Comamonadaceae bacterium]|nr:hypothetical protein [Comamonadaceae bacterium]
MIVEPLLASGELDALCPRGDPPVLRARASRQARRLAARGLPRPAAAHPSPGGRVLPLAVVPGPAGRRAAELYGASRPAACSCCPAIISSRASPNLGRIVTSA